MWQFEMLKWKLWSSLPPSALLLAGSSWLPTCGPAVLVLAPFLSPGASQRNQAAQQSSGTVNTRGRLSLPLLQRIKKTNKKPKMNKKQNQKKTQENHYSRYMELSRLSIDYDLKPQFLSAWVETLGARCVLEFRIFKFHFRKVNMVHRSYII